MRRSTGLGVTLLLLLLFAWPAALVAAEAGKVIAVRGEVTASDASGALRTLSRGDAVAEGETIATGANSFVRLRFSDGSSLHLRAGSRFAIEGYAHDEAGEAERSEFNLLRGGFRAVTGAIGRERPEGVKVTTPVSTIGIRGTDYQVRLCLGDCLDLGVDAPEDGLYTATYDGVVVIQGVEIGPGLYSFTAPGGATVLLEEGPAVLTLDVLPPPDEPLEEVGAGVDGEFEIPAREGSVLTLQCPL